MTMTQPVVEVVGATVRFPAELALDAVDFRMFAGEVHSLMGENGAGKSTLIKALTGALPLDAGVIRLAGDEVHFSTPHDALAAGISTVYQEIDLLPNLTVAENIWLGREPRRLGVIDWKRMRTDARAALADLGLDIDPASLLGAHSLAVQQLVAIARAISTDVKVLVLDEPTSSLDLDEVAELFRVIRELKQRGVAILFVSHFLDQVYEICDRVTVLRDGRLVGEYLTRELLRIDLVQKMLGRSVSEHVVALPQRPAHLRDRHPVPQRPRRDRRGHLRRGCRPRRGRGARRRRPARLGPHRARPRADRGRRHLGGHHPDRRDRSSTPASPGRRSRSGSSTPRRTAAPTASSASCRCARTSRSRCRPSAASSTASPPRGSANSPRAGSTPSTSAPPIRSAPPEPSRAATSRRCCSRGCWRSLRGCSCSTSRPAASTSARRSRSRTSSPSSPTTGCR